MDYFVAGVFALVYLGMILGEFPGLRLDRTGIALLGAIVLIASERISLDEAWAAIDVPTMALLLGLMVVSAQFRLGGFYTLVTRRLGASDHSPSGLLALVVITAGVLSAVLANDIVCLAMEDPPRKFFRLAPGREVRLRNAYLVTCTEVIKDAAGTIVELRGTYDPATRGGDAPDGRKVKATLHWVSAAHAVTGTVRLYDRLFTVEDPDGTAGKNGVDFTTLVNPASLETLADCQMEPMLANAAPGTRFQFERLGYFCADPDSAPGAPVFNRTVSLKDAWARAAARGD